MNAASAITPPDFLNSGGDDKQDVVGPLCHFGYFFVFTTCDDGISFSC
jgi:hypothetical protein